MQIRMTGKLYVNVLDHITCWPRFRPKFFKIKVKKVYSQNTGKILAKINIHMHILPVFLINFINIIFGKNDKIQRIFKHQFLKDRTSNLAQI